MSTGLLSKGITLGYNATSSTATMTTIAGLQSIPDLGSDTETVEVTTLSDGARRYIKGLEDYGSLDFEFLYDNSSATSSYRVCRTIEDATVGDTVYYFSVGFPDGTKFGFSGQATTKIGGAGVGDAMTFTMSIAVNSEIAVTNPTT